MTAPLRNLLGSPVADFLAHMTLAPRQAYKSLTLWPLVLRPEAPANSAAPPYVALADAHRGRHAARGRGRRRRQRPARRRRERGRHRRARALRRGDARREAEPHRERELPDSARRASVVLDVSCVEHGRWSRAAQRRASRRAARSSRRRCAGRWRSKVSTSLELTGQLRAPIRSTCGTRCRRGSLHAHADSRTGAYADYAPLARERPRRRSPPPSIRSTARWASSPRSATRWWASSSSAARRSSRASSRGWCAPTRSTPWTPSSCARASPSARWPGASTARSRSCARWRMRPSPAAPSLGLGEDLRLAAGGIAGCALAAGEVVHLTAFPSEPA